MYQSPADIIRALADDNSRIAKENILTEVFSDLSIEAHKLFVMFGKRALNPYETYGVKQLPTSSAIVTDLVGEELAVIVNTTLDDLAGRTLTGNDARVALESLAANIEEDEWNSFYKAVLGKDLRCGVSVKTWNNVAEKVNPALVVPVFACQLASDGAKHEKKMSGKKQVEVKLDGVRVIAIVKKSGATELFSRNGKPLSNFPHVEEQLSELANFIDEDMVFDGEVMSSSFQDLMKQVHRKDNVETTDAVLYLFDMVPLKNFEKGEWKVPQEKRSEELNRVITALRMNTLYKNDALALVGHEVVDLDTEDGQKRMKAINKEAINGGYEGIMLKNVEAPYECKRTTTWLKIKPVIEVTLEVSGVQEGTGRNEGRLGALICQGEDSGYFIEVNVGSGFSDLQRDEFWDARDAMFGRLVEVQADAITQNQDGSYSLRFPRFKGFRGFEIGEKI